MSETRNPWGSKTLFLQIAKLKNGSPEDWSSLTLSKKKYSEYRTGKLVNDVDFTQHISLSNKGWTKKLLNTIQMDILRHIFSYNVWILEIWFWTWMNPDKSQFYYFSKDVGDSIQSLDTFFQEIMFAI